MCGFLGAAKTEIDQEAFEEAFQSLKHRGPDDHQIVQVAKDTVFGFHRLSIRDTSNQLIRALQHNQATLKTNKAVVYSLVRQIVLPKVDVQGMSRSVVGRQAWFSAPRTVRRQFTQEFTQLVISTYANALASFTL